MRTLCIVFLSLWLALCSGAAAQDARETPAKQALIIEAVSGATMLSKDADVPIPPGSLAKLMTLEIVFGKLEAGEVSLDDEFVISENAWRNGGAPSRTSAMFAELGSSVRLEDLIKGVAVQAGNDGAIAIAEGIAGSELNFVKLMNARARELRLDSATFANPTGLPAAGQTVTLRDLVKLARHVWERYPQYRYFFSLPEFTWNRIRQLNRNPLLSDEYGAKGMMTGYTDEAGYGLIAVITRRNETFYLGLAGLETTAERTEESRRLTKWALYTVTRQRLFEAGEILGSATVYGGSLTSVPVTVREPVFLFTPVTNRDQLSAEVVYDGPIAAPVEKDVEIGVLRVRLSDSIIQEMPVFTAERVDVGSIHARARDAVEELLTGWMRGWLQLFAG